MLTKNDLARLILSQKSMLTHHELTKIEWSIRDDITIENDKELLNKLSEEYRVVDWWGVRIDKATAIQILKRQKKNKLYHLPFTLMSFEYGKDQWCDECDWECVCWNGLETDDIETLEEDDDNYYENFELRF
jgi:hypothetical protein